MSGPLRAADLPLRATQSLTLFTRPARGGLYELWVVGRHKTAGVVDHHFTTIDVASVLSYAAPGDLRWRPARVSDIPAARMGHGFIAGASISVDKVIDYDRPHYYVANGIGSLPLDRAALARARKHLPGCWTDSVVSLTLSTDSVLRVAGAPDARHPLSWAQPVPDTWTFRSWNLWLMHRATQRGVRIGVLHASESELHILQAPPTRPGEPALVARVFRRADIRP